MATTSFFSTGNTPNIEPGDFNTLVASLQAQSAELTQQYDQAEAANQEALAAIEQANISASTLQFVVGALVEEAKQYSLAAEQFAITANLAKDAAVSTVSNAFGTSYLGIKSEDPTLNNQGAPLEQGALYFNALANELRVYTGTIWKGGVLGASATITPKLFSGDGTQTQFTLDISPADRSNTQVFIYGVYQNKDTYSVNGPVITFSEAPPTGLNNIEVVVIATLPLGEAAGGASQPVAPGTGFTLPTTQQMSSSSHASLINSEGYLLKTVVAPIASGTVVGTLSNPNHTPLIPMPWVHLFVTDGTFYESLRGSVATNGDIKVEQGSTLDVTRVYISANWRH